MAFNGAWQMYSQENHEEFFKVMCEYSGTSAWSSSGSCFRLNYISKWFLLNYIIAITLWTLTSSATSLYIFDLSLMPSLHLLVENRAMDFFTEMRLFLSHDQPKDYYNAIILLILLPCVCVCASYFPAMPDTLIRIMRDVKPVTEIQQNGDDFVVTVKTPLRSTTNTFTLGRESIMKTLDGRKLKVSANAEPAST
ncbi:hypothetical protein ACEWY4_002961 [Coilia grayii]|uniref:Uncharacterized protein n=1 Tax=Coilia grayii TaxID=363190 RepID=A0ABD1KPT1_9TELE